MLELISFAGGFMVYKYIQNAGLFSETTVTGHILVASAMPSGLFDSIWIGSTEKLQETPYFMVKTMVSGVDFPLNQSNDWY